MTLAAPPPVAGVRCLLAMEAPRGETKKEKKDTIQFPMPGALEGWNGWKPGTRRDIKGAAVGPTSETAV